MKQFLKTLDRKLGYKFSSFNIAVKHKRAKNDFELFMQKNLGHFMIDVDPGPVGSEEIIMRTALLHADDVPIKVKEDYYFWSGYYTLLNWLKYLDHHGLNLRTVGSIMEFGCGSARLIRHLRCIDGIRLVGTDVKEEFIDWCRQNIPGIEFCVNDLNPPLIFVDNTFDLIYAESVFTHIPLETQELWINELHRVLRPGGFLMLSLLGRIHQLKMLNSEDQARLKQQGHLTLNADHPRASYSTQLIGSWDIFQTRGEILRAFGSVFEVLDYTPGVLDLLLLRKE